MKLSDTNTITISEMARLWPIDNAMPPPADTNIDDIDDINDINDKNSGGGGAP